MIRVLIKLIFEGWKQLANQDKLKQGNVMYVTGVDALYKLVKHIIPLPTNMTMCTNGKATLSAWSL
ncbi:MAG: hypothetical protein QNK20_01725 [Aureibaculum sp.]|nr:hypothetical protein [Aureibaculum sp.]